MPVPLCRCRVLYIGSAVPTVTKDGLQGIQQPLKERYPANEKTETKGIDSWLSVWSNGLLVEYIEGNNKTESAFYPITSLHYCAAVRYVNVTGFAIEGGGERFIPLDAPFANPPNSPHPPIFAAIFRRTTGVKVLECHAFICTNEKAANALVRCCFHSYADTIQLKMEDKIPGLKAIKESSRSATPSTEQNMSEQAEENLNKDDTDWQERAIGQKTWQRRQQSGEYDSLSLSTSMKGYKKSAKNQENEIACYQPPNHEPIRRGSAGSISSSPHGGFASFRPRSRHMMPPPPPMMMPPFNVPPPHMMPPHMMPPPHMMQSSESESMPPHSFMRPMFFGPRPLPPYFMHPEMFYPPIRPGPGGRFMFMPRPPFMHPFMDRPRTPNDGPIITSADSIYDTFPRGGGNYEEPTYSPGKGEGDHYHEVYKQYQDHRKRNSKSESIDESFDDGHRLWDQYEARIYRQPHMNEKAFAESLSKLNKKESPTPTDPNTPTATTKKTNDGRPSTPPADYNSTDLPNNSEPSTKRYGIY